MLRCLFVSVCQGHVLTYHIDEGGCHVLGESRIVRGSIELQVPCVGCGLTPRYLRGRKLRQMMTATLSLSLRLAVGRDSKANMITAS